MAVTLQLNKMSVEEKLQTMEAIWDDLCSSVEGVLSPNWHGEILKDRETALANGEDSFVDWEDAKNNIRNDIS